MLGSKPQPSPLTFPVLLVYPGYIGLMPALFNLCGCDRSMQSELIALARAGKMYLLDAKGLSLQVADWVPVKIFDNFDAFRTWLEGCVFSNPILINETQLSLDDYKKRVARAVRDRYRFDLDKFDGVRTIQKMRSAASYLEVLECVPDP